MKTEERGAACRTEEKLKLGEKKMKPGEKDLDLVVSKIKERELERRSGKDAQRPSLEVENSSNTRSSLAVRSPESRNRKGSGTESVGDISTGGEGRCAGGRRGAGEGRRSRKQEELLLKIGRGPPLLSVAPTRVKDSRPKGKTIRKAHYDPREVGQQFSMYISIKCEKLISTSGVG